MSKKSSAKRNGKKAVQSTVTAIAVTVTAASELSYAEMLSELEAIVSEADTRLTEEGTSL